MKGITGPAQRLPCRRFDGIRRKLLRLVASDSHPAGGAGWTSSVIVTFAFRCNMACTFCMAEDALDRFEGTSIASFRR